MMLLLVSRGNIQNTPWIQKNSKILALVALAALIFSVVMLKSSYAGTHSKNWRYLYLLGGSSLIDLGYLLTAWLKSSSSQKIETSDCSIPSLSRFESFIRAPWFRAVAENNGYFTPALLRGEFDFDSFSVKLPGLRQAAELVNIKSIIERENINLDTIPAQETYTLEEQKLMALFLVYPQESATPSDKQLALARRILQTLTPSTAPNDRFTWFLLDYLGEFWRYDAEPLPENLSLFIRHRVCALTLCGEFHKRAGGDGPVRPAPSWLSRLA